jgi:hypothetical protein
MKSARIRAFNRAIICLFRRSSLEMTVTTFLLSTLFGAASLSIGTRLIFGLKCHVIHQRKELFMSLLPAYWLFQVAWFVSRYRRLNSPLQWSALLSGAATLSIGTRLIFGLKCHVIHQWKALFMSLLSLYWLFKWPGLSGRYGRLNSPLQWSALLSGAASLSI